MKKLYDKSEITFAIMWIVIYTVTMGNLRNLGDDSPYMMIGLIVISVLMFLFVWKNGLMEKYGLSGWIKNHKEMLWLLPLWLITSGNLWGGWGPDYQGLGLLCGVVSMAFVGFAEELIFRGFLFKAMLKDDKAVTAIIVSSVTFGVGHILNLFTGHDFFPTLMQVFGAIAIGFIYMMVFYKSGSLLPCILSHSIIDVTSKLTPGKGEVLDWIYAAVLITTSIMYCLYLKKLPTQAVNQKEQ